MKIVGILAVIALIIIGAQFIKMLNEVLEKQEEKKEDFQKFIDSCQEISPDIFFEMKSRYDGDIVGVYVLYNVTKKIYYVGQSKRILFRINQHFTGHGNGDVYADYKYGDEFTIQLIDLVSSGYKDIDKLEREMIHKYHASENGYNRTEGNNS